MSLSLVVLAAGMGSRYGGLKQVDPVGPSGETVLDYAVFDAHRAGFDRVVFVIRRDFEGLFRERIGSRYSGKFSVEYVFQSLDALPPGFAPPPGRERPWGTGHAVWCARDVVIDPFAVINADDFYGLDSFEKLAAFLKSPPPVNTNALKKKAQFAMVGFRLENTLSEHGAVSRGVGALDVNGTLRSIVEQSNIVPAEVGTGRKYSGQEIVSMNCWGFTPTLFSALEAQLAGFLAARGKDSKAEFYLPAAISTMIAHGEADVRVLPTEAAWFGVTYREDKPRVQKAIEELLQAGEYPDRLF